MHKNKEQRDYVRQLEARMLESPRKALAEAVRFGVWGYLRIILWFVAVIGISCGVLAVYFYCQGGLQSLDGDGWLLLGIIGVVVLVHGGILLKILLVRIPPPDGYRLSEAEAPGLHALVEEVRAAVNAPRLKGILLTGEYNAAMASHHRFGMIGFQDHYIVIGLPFLMAHPVEEVRAVVAHELGHLVHRHGRVALWLARLSRSYAEFTRIIEQWRQGSYFSGQTNRGTERYWKKLSARAAVIKRHHEFEADQTAAGVAGAEVAARALYRVHFVDEAMGRTFWPAMWRGVGEQDIPPNGVLERLHEELQKPLPEAEAALVQQGLAARRTVIWEDHPCLSERLAALGSPPPDVRPAPEPVAGEQSALNLLAPDTRSHYMTLFSNAWKAQVISEWRARHKEAVEGAAKLAAREANPCAPQTAEEAWTLAAIQFNLAPMAEKAVLLREFLARYPGHADASFYLGRIHLRNGELEGALPLLQHASKDSTKFRAEALGELFSYYEQTGDFDMLDAVEEEIDAYNWEVDRARYERSTVFMKDKFLPQVLDAGDLGELKRVLTTMTNVKNAWLVLKECTYFPDMHCHVLLVEFRLEGGLLANSVDARMQATNEARSRVALPCLLVEVEDTFETPRRNIKAVPGSHIYSAMG